ncbi:MAG: UPF0489 family protein [Candidatus Muirbacterium halophilum]|nr:UPF0489 family protein [Candidatus Muirbacterium halophilum]MCK9476503.1 UPF0489 family protein [Candidatus Muirbacterium halophilum]
MKKLFIIEEHNEAFYVWMYCIKQGLMNRSDNVLLHVDHHSDFGVPALCESVNDTFSKSLLEIQNFTYKNLLIADFIVPAMYLGVFNEYYWLRRVYHGKNEIGDYYIKSHKREGKIFTNAPDDSVWKGVLPDDGRVVYKHGRLNVEESFNFGKSVFLDIDIDYFCSHRARFLQRRIKITEDEYFNILNDKYHFLNLEFNYSLLKEDNGFFVVLNDNLIELEKAHLTQKSVIDARIDDFCDYVKINNIIPEHIILCRSRFSNYTPENLWEYIENTIYSKLSIMFEFETVNIKDIVNG